ncbi:MAG: hypothetical protein AAB676_18480 [Verrucomicrobiota bacterium]
MRTASSLKKPFGTAHMVDITHVRFLDWEDAFDVEFEDGLSFLEPHATIKKANRISGKAVPVEVVLDEETRTGFEVRYDNGQVAEVSWAFIRELPPQKRALPTAVTPLAGAPPRAEAHGGTMAKIRNQKTRNTKRKT